MKTNLYILVNDEELLYNIGKGPKEVTQLVEEDTRYSCLITDPDTWKDLPVEIKKNRICYVITEDKTFWDHEHVCIILPSIKSALLSASQNGLLHANILGQKELINLALESKYVDFIKVLQSSFAKAEYETASKFVMEDLNKNSFYISYIWFPKDAVCKIEYDK